MIFLSFFVSSRRTVKSFSVCFTPVFFFLPLLRTFSFYSLSLILSSFSWFDKQFGMQNEEASRGERANRRVQWLMSISPGLVLFFFPIGCLFSMLHAIWKLLQSSSSGREEEFPDQQKGENYIHYHYFGQSIYVGLLFSYYLERPVQFLLAIVVVVDRKLVGIGLLALFSSFFRCFLKDNFPQYVLGGRNLPLESTEKVKFFYKMRIASFVYSLMVVASSLTIYASVVFLNRGVEGDTLLLWLYFLLLISSCVDCVLSMALWFYAWNPEDRISQTIIYSSLYFKGFANFYSVRLSTSKNFLIFAKAIKQKKTSRRH